MKHRVLKELEVVELTHDIPEHNLKKCERGTIVEIYKNGEAYEVEFVNAKGRTLALLTLNSVDVRSLKSTDVLHVRGFNAV